MDRDSPYTEDVEHHELATTVKQNWNAMKTFHRCHLVMDVLNVRLWDPEVETFEANATELLEEAWNSAGWQCKMNASVGCILKHKISERYRYFHASPNEGVLLRAPMTVGSLEMLERFTDTVSSQDLHEHGVRRRPDTEWRLYALTNVAFYLYKLRGVNKVGHRRRDDERPSYMLQNKNLLCLLTDPKTGVAYDDNMCFFRCLALAKDCACEGKCRCTRANCKTVKKLFRKFCDETGVTINTFPGIYERDLLDLEKMFDVAITVFTLQSDNKCDIIWYSKKTDGLKLNLNLYESHFGYIRDVNGFCRSFNCVKCDAFFTRASNVKRHVCDAGKVTEFRYSTGVFSSPPNVWDVVERETGIVLPSELRFYPYWMTYDIESVLLKERLPTNTTTTTFHSEHQLVSVSVCSNIPDFSEPMCFVRQTTVDECVQRFAKYIEKAAMKAEELLLSVYGDACRRVADFIKVRAAKEKEFEEAKFSNKRTYDSRVNLCGLMNRILAWIRQVPLVGFNSQKYDLNVMKAALMKCFVKKNESGEEESTIQHVVKKQDSMTCVLTDYHRIMDMVNIIGPGYSYDGYLKAFGVSQTKGFFPYEWLDSLEKLNVTELPPVEAFYSALKKETIREEDYAVVVKVWRERGMKTVKDLLIWYNNLDVEPFVEAIGKQQAVYRQKGIDMLKDAFSAPGISVLWLNAEVGKRPSLRNAYDNTSVTADFYERISDATASTLRIHKFDDDHGAGLFKLFRDNLVGGPSIVFHREHEKGKTRLRENVYGDAAEACQVILGLDANALYLHCLTQDLPVGMPKVRLAENEFCVEGGKSRFGKSAQGWLAWSEFKDNVLIETAVNGGERRLGQHNLPVDGFSQDTSTVYQFHGCYWHGHDCGVPVDGTVRGMTAEARLAQTRQKEEYFRSLGYRVKAMWECEWSRQVSASIEKKTFLSAYFGITYGKLQHGVSTENILARVSDGRLFGFVECDVSVPDEKLDYFSEMSPVFKNIELTREHLSPHMKQFAEEFGFLKQPQRYLVGSLKGEKVLLLTELLRWYLEKGLVVTKIHRVIEYERAALFKKFGASVTAARRAGDVDPSLKLVADTNKLIGNSAYGKLCQDKSKHKNVVYSSCSKKTSEAVRSGLFHSLNVLDEQTFEITMHKKRVRDRVIGFSSRIVVVVAPLARCSPFSFVSF